MAYSLSNALVPGQIETEVIKWERMKLMMLWSLAVALQD
jgi:hypothetical protein